MEKIILANRQEYSENEIENARCPKCNECLELDEDSKPGLVSAVCCNLLYGIYPVRYRVLIDEMD